MAAQLRIRAAVAADVPVILGLIRELARFEKLLDQVSATEVDLHRGLFGARSYAEALLAEQDGEPAGFALFFHNFSTFLGRPGLYLEDLYVREPARGHGIGLALLAQVARIAVERGCPRLDWAVLDWNSGAIDFYERLGARPEVDWQLYRLRGDALAQLARRAVPGKAQDPAEAPE